jgi:hypothetical protein
MSFPAFIPQKLGETAQTTIIQIIKVVNNLMGQLLTIFTYLFKKVQLDSVILTQVQLQVGSNQIPHTLNRTLSGWQIVRMRNVQAIVWDTQDTNANPGTYLQLTSNAAVVVDILVF